MYTGFLSIYSFYIVFACVWGKYADSEAEYAVRLLRWLKCALGKDKSCSRKLTWLAGWVMLGRCFVSNMVDSVSPLVWTISAGPLEAVFSMIGIRSSNAGLHVKDKEIGWGQETRARSEPSNIKSDWLLKLRTVGDPLPHVIIFFEKCIIFHSSLLQLHVYAAAIYWHHFFDSTAGQNENKWKIIASSV